MFSKFNHVVVRQSNAVQYISANPITGIAKVMFKNGSRYTFTNVSRCSIINLILNHNISLGFWINENCLKDVRVKSRFNFYIPGFAER